MDPSRRRFVAGAAALASVPLLPGCKKEPGSTTDTAVGATPERPPEPPPWEAPGTLDEEAFAWSVQAGDVTSDSALLSARTTEPEVELVVVQGVDDDWVEMHREVLTPVEEVVQLELDGLEADAVYRFALYAADGSRRSRIGRFRTALGDGGFRKVVFGATSCLGSVSPEWGNLVHAAGMDLDLFLLLGDTVYTHATTLDEYREEWKAALSVDALRDLTASTSVVATWDDHEVANNWYLEEVTFDETADAITVERRDTALEAFREAIPQRIGPGGLGLWRTLRWGDVLEIVVLDSRGERDAVDRIVSDEQLAWAVETVTNSTATFKIVMASAHLTDHTLLFGTVQEKDRWQGYPEQRQALVEALLATTGVLVITGDMHYGAVQHLAPPGELGHGIYEVAAGPSGSRLNLVPAYADLPDQYPTLVTTWSFCRFEADPGTGEVRVQFVGDDGEVLADQILAIAPPARP